MQEGLRQTPRILIVDDEAGIRSLLSVAFARAGYEVRTASNALQAMALCASESFDAMLSDVVMPMMDGHDLVRWIAKNYPGVRCVLMTAHDVDCQECPFTPRCKLLPKPFRPKDALSRIEETLRESPNQIGPSGTGGCADCS
jgi:two-component system cell cycle response regulator CpdR